MLCFSFELCRKAGGQAVASVAGSRLGLRGGIAVHQHIHAGALAWVSDLQHQYDTNTHKLLKQGLFTYDHGANEKGYPIAEADREQMESPVIELLELAGLSERDLHRYPSDFSGGQRQHIGIARAISLNPDFLWQLSKLAASNQCWQAGANP